MIRWKRSALLLLCVTSAILLYSCNVLELEKPLPYEWVQPGSQFVYDFIAVGEPIASIVDDGVVYDTTKEALVLDIVRGGRCGMRFDWSYTVWTSIPGEIWAGRIVDDLSVCRRQAGLYNTASKTCDGQGDPNNIITFVRAPARPKVGQEFHEYRCEGEITRTFTVVDIDKSVTVRAGSFKTFVLEPDGGEGREYWSADAGIIKIERMDENGEVIGAYELAEARYR